jgi:hypothetical protein
MVTSKNNFVIKVRLPVQKNSNNIAVVTEADLDR